VYGGRFSPVVRRCDVTRALLLLKLKPRCGDPGIGRAAAINVIASISHTRQSSKQPSRQPARKTKLHLLPLTPDKGHLLPWRLGN